MSNPVEKRFKLVTETYNPAIVDQEHNLNFAFLASSGMGVTSSSIELAEKVVGFLNSLPAKDTLLYPYNRPQQQNKH